MTEVIDIGPLSRHFALIYTATQNRIPNETDRQSDRADIAFVPPAITYEIEAVRQKAA